MSLPPGEMEVEILEDGTLKITTGNMAGENHMAADQFLKQVEKLMGGKMVTVKSKDKGEHYHHHHHGEGHHTH